MRFLVDECSGPALAQWLQSHGHDVFSVYDEARGMDDDEIVQKHSPRTESWSRMTKTLENRCIESNCHTKVSSFCVSTMSERPARLRSCGGFLKIMLTGWRAVSSW